MSLIQYDATATINEPPNTEAFDPVRRRAALTARTPQTPASPSVCDLTHVTALISALQPLVSGLSSSAGQARIPATPTGNRRLPSTLVSTPSHRTALAATPSSGDNEPLVYQPSDVTLYLHFAQKRLGVQDALNYEAALQEAAFGPDILSKVSLLQLTELGIKTGDAVRLREHAETWWNAEARKSRKRALQVDKDSEMQQQKRARVYYQTTYKGGGGKRWEGGPLRERRPEHVIDPDIELVEYYNEALGKFCPVPNGFMAREDHIIDEDDIFAN